MGEILTIFLGFCAMLGFGVIGLVVYSAIANAIDNFKLKRKLRREQGKKQHIHTCYSCQTRFNGPTQFPCSQCTNNPIFTDLWTAKEESDD